VAKKDITDVAKSLESLEEKDRKILGFKQILDSIENLDDKKRILWKEIYENALQDRESASVLFTDIWMQIRGNAANHNLLGPVAAKYIERMSRANDQIIKLSEMMTEEDNKSINADDVFSMIGKGD
jgi:hypothetical protein